MLAIVKQACSWLLFIILSAANLTSAGQLVYDGPSGAQLFQTGQAAIVEQVKLEGIEIGNPVTVIQHRRMGERLYMQYLHHDLTKDDTVITGSYLAFWDLPSGRRIKQVATGSTAAFQMVGERLLLADKDYKTIRQYSTDLELLETIPISPQYAGEGTVPQLSLDGKRLLWCERGGRAVLYSWEDNQHLYIDGKSEPFGMPGLRFSAFAETGLPDTYLLGGVREDLDTQISPDPLDVSYWYFYDRAANTLLDTAEMIRREQRPGSGGEAFSYDIYCDMAGCSFYRKLYGTSDAWNVIKARDGFSIVDSPNPGLLDFLGKKVLYTDAISDTLRMEAILFAERNGKEINLLAADQNWENHYLSIQAAT